MNSFTDVCYEALEFLWLELTIRCNLRCVHCYAESEPSAPLRGALGDVDYASLIIEAANLGCRKLQFIGGEPTLHPSLPSLIKHARECGMEFVEVYTNAVRISDDLLTCFREYQISVAVSFYSDDPTIHDKITNLPGSHRRTIKNLTRLLNAGLKVRAGIIEMDINSDSMQATTQLLSDLG